MSRSPWEQSHHLPFIQTYYHTVTETKPEVIPQLQQIYTSGTVSKIWPSVCKHFSSFNCSEISLEIVNEIHMKGQTRIRRSTFYQPEQRFYSECTTVS